MLNQNDQLQGRLQKMHASPLNREVSYPDGSAQIGVNDYKADSALLSPIGSVKLDQLNSSDWRRQLSDFLHQYGRQRSNNFQKLTSEETFRNRKNLLFSSIVDLRKDRGLKTLSQIKPKYLPRLFEIWTAKGISKRAQINYYNVFRWFWRVCGMEIEPIAHYAKYDSEFTINRNAQEDKSWEGNGVDFDLVFQKLDEIDPVAARLALMMKTYGLRLKESLCLNPHESTTPQGLMVLHGSKTGRKREINFEELDDKTMGEVLEKIKQEVPDYLHMAWKKRSLQQALRRMNYLAGQVGLTKGMMGVTWHGLRHQFAIQKFEELTGTEPPVRGGQSLDYKKLKEARQKITLALGHNRTKVTGAYYGNPLTQERFKDRNFERSVRVIEPAIAIVRDLLLQAGVLSFYLIGSHAKGEAAAQNAPYEFLLAEGTVMEIALTIAPQIAEAIKQSCGVDCVVLIRELLPASRIANLESESIPLIDLYPVEVLH